MANAEARTDEILCRFAPDASGGRTVNWLGILLEIYLAVMRAKQRLATFIDHQKQYFDPGRTLIFDFQDGDYSMDHETAFQIVCSHCACLSIRIEEPLKSSRAAMVFCGDCGQPRGTVGALRDLAVQRHVSIVVPAPSLALSADEPTEDKQKPSPKISAQYAELQRLREQVRIAEWLASGSRASRRKRNEESVTLQPSYDFDRSLGGKRSWKMPSLESDDNQLSKA